MTLSTVLLRVLAEGEGPEYYSGTTGFLDSFFNGAGIGYWFFFLVAALIAMGWLIFDSNNRKLDVMGWKIGVVVGVILLLPAMLFKFTVNEPDIIGYFGLQAQIDRLEYTMPDGWVLERDELVSQQQSMYPPLTGMREAIVYLGVLGGLGSVVLAAAYYMTYKDQVGGAPMGAYGQPGMAPPPPPPMGGGGGYGVTDVGGGGGRGAPAAAPQRFVPKVSAWLVSSDGKNHQLNQGETHIGRSTKNDIAFSDTKVSGTHAKITEQNGHFRLVDLGSTNGTWVNGRRVRQPVLLDADDEVRFGDNITVRFKK